MSPRLRRAPGPRGRLATLLLAAACAAMACSSLLELARNRAPLAELLPVATGWLLAGLGLSAAAAVGALVTGAWALRRGGSPQARSLPWRLALEVLLAGLVLHLLFAQPYRALLARATLGLCAGAVALLSLAWPRLAAARSPRLLSALDLIAFALALALIGGELALSICAASSSSPLFAREQESVEDYVSRYRLDPRTSTPDYPVNAGGHFDTAFHAKEPGTPLGICIGDSFSTSVVPHALHFTTLAERLLGCGEIHNMGFAGIGLNIYLHLLESEALPLRPDVVVVDVFVGNDLAEGLKASRPVGWLQRCMDERQLLLALVPRRLLRVQAAQPMETRPLEGGRAAEDSGAAGARNGAPAVARTPEQLAQAFPWLADPRLETPGYSELAFTELEQRRARAVCAPEAPPAWPRIHELLAQMHARCGEVPFCVMLIPDEFQVEEAVWELVRSGPGGAGLERDLPQRELIPWLASEGIPCLDLLPALRAVPPLEDGRRHLYHARDTHFNARGNDVAGRELARFLAPHWP
jgi:hypothetical protein